MFHPSFPKYDFSGSDFYYSTVHLDSGFASISVAGIRPMESAKQPIAYMQA